MATLKNPKPQDEAQGIATLRTSDWLDVLARIVKCFGECEGTWYQSEWKHYGVTPDQEAAIESAVEKLESASNDALCDGGGEKR